MPKYGVKRPRKAPVEESTSSSSVSSSSSDEAPILPHNPPAASASARPQQFMGAADTPIASLLRDLPMDHYPFSLMPLIADYLQSDEHIYKKGITRPTIKNSSRHESKLRVFPAFAPFCAAPPVEEDDEDNNINKQKSLSEYAPTYHLIWLFQTIVLPTRFGNKHEPLYDGEVPPSYYFPQPPTDDEVEAFYTHPEVRAAMPAVSEEERERFRKARPLAQLRKERRTEKHKVYQGGCWVIKSTGNHLDKDKEEASNPTTTTTHHQIIDTHARGAAPFRLIHPTISARSGASGAVGMQLSSAVTHLTYRRNAIFGPPNTLPYNNYSDPSLVLGIERGMYGGYEGMMRGALYFEVWWGWGKAAKNKGMVAAIGGGVPTLLPERGYGDDCRASPHSSVMYLSSKQYNILHHNRQSGDNADDESPSDEGDDFTTVDGDEDPATEEERMEKEHRSRALKKAKRVLRQQVIDELVLARPLTHLRKHFPIGSLSAQVEVSVQTDDQSEEFMGVAPPPLVHPHVSYVGTPWKLEEDGGLSSLIATAYHADGRPLPPSHELRFIDPRTTNSRVAEEEGSPRITVTTRWSNHTGEDMSSGGLAKCVGVQTEWEDLPIPPPKHFAHYFPPAAARQAKRQS